MKKASWCFWAFIGLVWILLSLPFSDYSLTSPFDLSDGSPQSHDGMQKLLQNIVFAANVSTLSIFVLFGLNRGWHLDDGYPRWLQRFNLQVRFRDMFESRAAVRAVSIVLALLGLVLRSSLSSMSESSVAA